MAVKGFHVQVSAIIVRYTGSHYTIVRRGEAAHVLVIKGLCQALVRMRAKCESWILPVGEADFVLTLKIRVRASLDSKDYQAYKQGWGGSDAPIRTGQERNELSADPSALGPVRMGASESRKPHL